jgi:hypothetical protein
MPKIAEVKLSSCGLGSCGLRKKLRLRNCGVAVAEQHFCKSCGIAIVEVLTSSCGIAVADSKKSCACPPLIITKIIWTRRKIKTEGRSPSLCWTNLPIFRIFAFHVAWMRRVNKYSRFILFQTVSIRAEKYIYFLSV